MNNELLKIRKRLDDLSVKDKKESEIISLYPGISLWYTELKADSFSVKHSAAEHIIQINYCKSGQISWKTGNGKCIHLNSGDFSLNTMDICAESKVTLPTGQYSGLTVCIDLKKTADNPPDLLKGTNIFSENLPKKFSRGDTVLFYAGNEQTESIFSYFYNQPDSLKLPYQKIKVLELLLYLYELEFSHKKQLSSYQSEQVEIIREIHDRMLNEIGTRITIEELSRQYLINPTTLKTAFKSVYGTSIAAHIKEHRMKKAAEMLRESNMSIAEIAQAVGYDSQSKFTAAFKAFYQVLPKEYKRKY